MDYGAQQVVSRFPTLASITSILQSVYKDIHIDSKQ